MKCENNLCIYCNDEKCLLKDISINEMGMCDDCILVNISDEVLQEEKQKLLEKLK